MILFGTAEARGAEATNSSGSASEWVVRSWQTEDGLPQNTVNAILQTRDGFLWVGTSGGLARFDGARFRTFGLHDGLRSVHVFRLAEDRDGTLWVGTVGGGVSRFENGSFTTFGGAEGLEGTVPALQADADGSLWIGTERGLIKWSRGTFATIGPAQGLPRKQIRALAQDTNGTLWVSVMPDGVFRGTNGHFVLDAEAPKRNGVYSLLAARDGSVWAGSGNGQLSQWRDGTWTYFGRTNGLPGQSFESLAQDREGSLWFTAQNSGLYRFGEGRFVLPTNENRFPGQKLTVTTVDHDGSIWVGTASGGLFRLSRRMLHHWGASAGLANTSVTSVTEDAAGHLWIGTDKGVHRARDGRFSRFTEPTDYLLYPRTYTSAATSDGSIWAAGEGFLFRARPGEPTKSYLEEPVRGEAIRALCADGENLWLGTYFSGLLKWETNHLRIVATNGSFGGDITSLARESEDTLWVGSSSGLYKWERGAVREWTTRGALLSSNIRALHRDPDGTLWIGTLGGGLGRLRNGTLFNITTRHGLIDDVISQIIPDDFGHLWLGCNRGIMRLDRQDIDWLIKGRTPDLQPLVFGKNEGMLKEQCTGGHSPTALKTRDGRLLFPTVEGIVEIDPRRLEEFMAHAGPATIDTVLLDGQPQALNETLAVPPGSHRVEIGYSAPSLRGGEWLRFSYRLRGVDDEWKVAGTRRRVTYEALPPGDYVFRVAVYGTRGARHQEAARLEFTVQPFFWQTRWFRVGAGLLVAGMTAIVVGGFAAARRRREQREFKRAQEQLAVLLHLSAHPAVTSGDLPAASREICEQAARMLGVSRVGIWLFDEKSWELRAANVFDSATGHNGSGEVLALSGAPQYMEALQRERVIVVRDVQQDPRTAELSESHFRRSGVASVLDAPVRVSEKFVAVIRHARIGPPRDWKRDEISFAREMADQLAQVLLNAERENANRQVRESEARFRTMANAAPVMIWMAGTDKLCSFFNRGWLEFTGRTLEQERGHGWTEGVHPEDFSTCLQTYENSFDARRDFTMEYRLRKHDGEYAWVLDTGAPRFAGDGAFLGYIGSASDVTALKQAQERMTLAADAAQLGMWVWEIPSNRLWTSERCRTLFGYGLDEEMSLRKLQDRVHPDDFDMCNAAVRDALTGVKRYDFEYRLLLPTRVVRWVSASGRVDRDETGQPVRMLGIAIDVTERKQAEEAAREVSGKLITAQEDERKRIARDLHDDLTQRLALLSVETDLLGQMDNNAPVRSMIEGIGAQVRDLSSEVHKLSYQLHPAKLEQLGLVSATRSLCQELTKQCGVPVDFASDPISRDLDRAVALCLYRIIQEGLQNMVKHSRATRARVELRMNTQGLRLAVSDDGQGFDMHTVSHHAGLGLVGMRERVRLVHGHVAFHSAPGQGTRIEVSVPMTVNAPVIQG